MVRREDRRGVIQRATLVAPDGTASHPGRAPSDSPERDALLVVGGHGDGRSPGSTRSPARRRGTSGADGSPARRAAGVARGLEDSSPQRPGRVGDPRPRERRVALDERERRRRRSRRRARRRARARRSRAASAGSSTGTPGSHAARACGRRVRDRPRPRSCGRRAPSRTASAVPTRPAPTTAILTSRSRSRRAPRAAGRAAARPVARPGRRARRRGGACRRAARVGIDVQQRQHDERALGHARVRERERPGRRCMRSSKSRTSMSIVRGPHRFDPGRARARPRPGARPRARRRATEIVDVGADHGVQVRRLAGRDRRPAPVSHTREDADRREHPPRRAGRRRAGGSRAGRRGWRRGRASPTCTRASRLRQCHRRRGALDAESLRRRSACAR